MLRFTPPSFSFERMLKMDNLTKIQIEFVEAQLYEAQRLQKLLEDQLDQVADRISQIEKNLEDLQFRLEVQNA